MPISYIGNATATDNGGNATYTLSLSGVTGLTNGDLVVVCYGWSSVTDDTVGLPSGNTSGAYTAVCGDLYSNDSGDSNFRMAYQFMGSTPDTSITVNGKNSNIYASAAVALVFRGVHTTTTLDGVTVQTATGVDGSQANPPAITPSTAGAWVVAGYGGVGDATPLAKTAPANMTGGNQARAGGTTWGWIAGCYYYNSWTSGSFNPDAWTGGETPPTQSWAAATAVLRPAAQQTVSPTKPSLTITPGVPSNDISAHPQAGTVTVSPGAWSLRLGVGPNTASVIVVPGPSRCDHNLAVVPRAITVTPGSATTTTSRRVDPPAPVVVVSVAAAAVAHALDPAGPALIVTPGDWTTTWAVAPVAPVVTVTSGGADAVVVSTSQSVTVTPVALTVALGSAQPGHGLRPATGVVTITAGTAEAASTVTPGPAVVGVDAGTVGAVTRQMAFSAATIALSASPAAVAHQIPVVAAGVVCAPGAIAAVEDRTVVPTGPVVVVDPRSWLVWVGPTRDTQQRAFPGHVRITGLPNE